MKMFANTLLLLCTLLQTAESVTLQFDLTNRVAVTAEAMAATMENMTFQSAYNSVVKQLGENRVKRATLDKVVLGKGQLRSGGIDEARNMLNDMIGESQLKKDGEESKCSEYEIRQSELIEETQTDISNGRTQASEAQGLILIAQQCIDLHTVNLPKFENQLRVFTLECNSNLQGLAHVISIIQNDLRVMQNLLGLIARCASSVAPRTTLVQLTRCKHKRRPMSLITFTDRAVRTAVSELGYQSNKLLQGGLEEIYRESKDLQPTTAQNVAAAVTPDRSKQNSKCSVATHPDCDRMRDKFLEIVTNIESRLEDLYDQQSRMNQKCTLGIKNFKSEIDDTRGSLGLCTAQLATSTSTMNTAIEFHRMKSTEYRQFISEYRHEMATCHTNIKTYISEICGVRKIRTELFKMEDKKDILPQDCEVSDWSASECSLSCGGGEQTLSRTVTMQMQNFGRDCPPLSQVRLCNEDPCPIDCTMGDWSGWGACSADCGTGVQERSRGIASPAENNGNPCGAQKESMNCNVDDCDQPCVLSEWSGWSTCSKKCDRGMNERTKKVIQAALGQGHCAAQRHASRLEYKFCNDAPCALTLPVTIPKCESKLDVMILLDGSGSIRSGGWAQTKKAAEDFVGAMDGGDDKVQVGAILFSGPRTKAAYDKCTEHDATNPPDMKLECGIEVVSHLSTDTADVKTKIEALDWPASTTLTSVALKLAQAELGLGRADASSIVIVITDGKPLNKHRTSEAAKKIREVARLLWVPVTRNAPLSDIRKWASNPKSENVLRIPDFAALSKPETLATIMADICPDLVTAEVQAARVAAASASSR